MIRTSVGNKEALLRLARLTRDTVSFVDSDVWSFDGQQKMDFVDMTVLGNESDEQRFWTAWRAYTYVASGYDADGKFIGLVRQVTDEEVVKTYGQNAEQPD